MRKRGWAILIMMMLVPFFGKAQEVLPYVWRVYLEQLSEDGEDEIVEDLVAVFGEYSINRVSVNDTVSGLRVFPFVSDYQRDCLRAYIVLFGPLVSVDELHGVNGFDTLTIELLRPLVDCSIAQNETKITLKDLVTRGSSNLVAGVGGTVEQAKGYSEDIYEGDNLRMMWRYYYKYKDKIQLQVSGDKDPGEALFSGSKKQGFDFYGFSLMINDIGWGSGSRGFRVKRLMVGQYHLQFGQGLALWSGMGARSSIGANIGKYGQGIRPSGAFSEYGYLQGGATTLALDRHWDLSVFYSYVNRAATLPRGADKDSSINWVQSIYNSGYFRTQTELAKKNQLVEQLAGGHLQYGSTNVKVGFTGVHTWFDKAIIPAKTVYNDNYFQGDRNTNLGVDFMYRKGGWLLFGETALCVNDGLDSLSKNYAQASILGSELAIGTGHKLSGQLRYYSPTYHSFHSSALGQGGEPQNEMGAALYYQGRLPWGMTATAMADFFYFPHEKYLIYGPSRGKEFRAMLSKPFRQVDGLTINLRYRYKDKGRNVIPTTLVDGAYQLEQTYRHQIQGDIEYRKGSWRLVSRVAYACYYGDKTMASSGFLFYQDLMYEPKRVPLTLAARVAWFDVDDYEARLYTVESDFIYQYNSNVYQNEGYRGYLVVRYDISKNWNIGFKYGVTIYSDRDTFGSGNDLIDANHRQQWRIQLRWKW